MAKLTLYGYQEIDRHDILRSRMNGKRLILAVWTMGAGKSLLAQMVVDAFFKDKSYGINKAVIACPLHAISAGFDNDGAVEKQVWYSPANAVYSKAPYVIDTEFEMVKKNTVAELSEYFEDNNKKNVAKIFTHSSLTSKGFGKYINSKESLANCVFVIDESQHSFVDKEDEDNSTRLGHVVEKLYAKGATVILLSATPYRTSQGSRVTSILEMFPHIDPKDIAIVVRTTGEQMADGLSPALDIEYQKINDIKIRSNHRSNGIGDKMDSTISKPHLNKVMKDGITKDWIKDGYPKGIIIIPAGRSIKTAEEVIKYLGGIKLPEDVYKKRGRKNGDISILNAVGGNSSIEKDALIKKLVDDKKSGGRLYDLVIACRKFDEGSDCPSASHLYCYGAPSNVRLFHQRVGRVLRNKNNLAGYSEYFGDTYKNLSKVYFYIPADFKATNLDAQVANQVLNCIFAAEHYKEYCDYVSVSAGLKQQIQKHYEKVLMDKGATAEQIEQIGDFKSKLNGIISKSEMNDAKITQNIMGEIYANPNINYQELAERLTESFPDDKTETMLKIVSIMSSMNGSKKSNMIAMVDAIFGKAIRGGDGIGAPRKKKQKDLALDPVFSIINEELRKIIDKFGKEKVSMSESKNRIDKAMISLSGTDYKSWADECKLGITDEQHSLKQTKLCDEFKTKHGHYPIASSKDDYERKLSEWLQSKKSAKKNGEHK